MIVSLMKIAVDLDKTIFECNSQFYNIVNEIFPYISHSNSLKYVRLNRLELKNNLLIRLYKKLFSFTNITNYEEKPDAIKYIAKLCDKGHEVVILSSRPKYQIASQVIKDLSKKYNINDRNIFLACPNKPLFCEAFDVDILIDNNPTICRLVQDMGTLPILFSNKEYDGLLSLSSWQEIYEFVDDLDQTINKTH